MNIELMRKWLVALRSDEYVQVRNRMRIDDTNDPKRKKHCCAIGVLADVVVKSGELSWDEPEDGEIVALVPIEHGVCDAFEFLEDLTDTVEEDLLDKVIGWNDSNQLSFSEIAERLRHRVYRAERKRKRGGRT
jgi:hypothetical protein